MSPQPATTASSSTASSRAVELEILTTSAGRRSLSGFFLCGVLLSFLGMILPAWGYHLLSQFKLVGYYFLALGAGQLLALRLSRYLLNRLSVQSILILSSLGAAAGLILLGLYPPPSLMWWRMGGLVTIGASAGLLSTTVFHAITPVYRQDPAGTLNLSSMLYGAGSLACALLVAATYYVYTPANILFWIALVALLLGVYFRRGKFPKTPAVQNLRAEERRSLKSVARDFQSPGAVLFGLLLFFQFGNEGVLAGWLPLLLVQRLGVSPATALWILAEYWFFLVVGRGVAQALLPRVSHPRLLLVSLLSATVGCLILATTVDVFGAVMAVFFVGSGFAMIYPLVTEKIGKRFHYYHPGFYNGIFSFANAGAVLAPFSVGYLTDWFGISAVMLLPLLGTLTVFLLLAMISLESRLTSAK